LFEPQVHCKNQWSLDNNSPYKVLKEFDDQNIGEKVFLFEPENFTYGIKNLKTT